MNSTFITNLSLKQISLAISVLFTLLNGIVVFFLLQWNDNTWLFLLCLVALAVTGFFVVQYMLEQNVFRKLKVIYKIIRNSKKTKLTKDQELDDYSLEVVNKEVLDWATNTQAEIRNLKSLENYRKEFVGNISHELKTPIFNMQGYIHTLLDGALHDDAINTKYLRKAATNLERLQNIVEDLESISRLESEADMVDMRPFNVKQLVEEVIADLELMATKNTHKFDFNEKAAKAYQVMADRNMIRQVIVNLLTNSVKYSKEEEGITIISFYDLDKHILVEVTDNGIGIDEKHLKHLFDRFYRVDSSRSRKFGGSGLGLSIVKHIIEAHKQTINVRSSPGVGSTFGFTLRKAT